jgi:hypothetical protein
MQIRVSILRQVCGAGALIMAASTVSSAQEVQVFQWSGRVDQEIRLTATGRTVTASNIGPSEPGQRDVSIMAPIPRIDGELRIQTLEGRGTVDVLQQPTALNGYTAVVRIRDPQGGTGSYRFNAYWQASSAGEVGPPYGRGRGRMSRTALTWRGDVDDNLEIRIAPSGVTYQTLRGRDPRGVQSSFNALPANVSRVMVNQTEGRGQIVVIQQPTPENGNIAVLRIRDPQRGYGHYTFNVTWR